MATLIDSYSESNYSATFVMYSGSYTGVAQAFTNSVRRNISSCKFFLQKTGSPPYSITASLHSHSGTYGTSSVPTGAALATSSEVFASSLSATMSLVEFTFSEPYSMDPDTYYEIVVNYSGGDNLNYVTVGADNTSPTHSGNRARYLSSWLSSATADVCFYVYGELPVTNTGNFFMLF